MANPLKSFFRILAAFIIGAAFTGGGVYLYNRITDFQAAPSLPEDTAAVITHIIGPVFVLRGDQIIPAHPGRNLEPGDVLKVTENAVAQVQFANKGSTLLGSDSLVRFRKITGADRRLELRTEILTGTMFYRVEKLDANESVIIETSDAEYEVHGTEFLIVKTRDETTLAVAEGRVRASGGKLDAELLVKAEEQLQIRAEEGAGEVEPLNDLNRERLQQSAPLSAMPFGFRDAPAPVRVEIVTHPADSVIYIDGLRIGTGHFRSFLQRGTEIDVRVRRRGFRDYTTRIVADSDQYIEIQLEPASMEETLAEEEEESVSFLTRLRADYERRLDELRQILAGNAAERAEERARMAAESARRESEAQALLEMEKANKDVLAVELADSQAENQKLRDLIQQIEDLAENE